MATAGVGNHIAFNAGEYNPSSPEGQHVLAHVRQQTGGAVSMLPQEDVAMKIDPDERLEREAEETAQRVMSGGELGIQRMRKTEVHAQRSVKDRVSSAVKGAAGLDEDEDLTAYIDKKGDEKLSQASDTKDKAVAMAGGVKDGAVDAAGTARQAASDGWKAFDDHLEPRGREPDTVIELLPLELESIEYFQSFMDHYLRCQIRDCFVCMGVTPPEEFRVLGMGRFAPMTVYVHVDFYPEFHNPDSEAFSEKRRLF